jgi:hypothetical protein
MQESMRAGTLCLTGVTSSEENETSEATTSPGSCRTDAVSAGRDKPGPPPAAARSKCDRAENLSVLTGTSEEENTENTEDAVPSPTSTKSDKTLLTIKIKTCLDLEPGH